MPSEKKVVRRYSLVLKVSDNYIDLNNTTYDKEKERLDNLNRSDSHDYFYTNIYPSNDGKMLYYTTYRRTLNKFTLEEVDNLTMHFKNEKELLKAKFESKNNRVRIAYKANNQVRTLRVLYSNSKDLMNFEAVKFKFTDYWSNNEFLLKLIDDPVIKGTSLINKDENGKQPKYLTKDMATLDSNYRTLEEHVRGIKEGKCYTTSHEAFEFFLSYVNETVNRKEKRTNYLRLRQILSFMIDYENPESKVVTDKETTAINTQMSLFEYAKDNNIELVLKK